MKSYNYLKNINIKSLLFQGIPEQNKIFVNLDNEHAMVQLSKIEYDPIKFKLSDENISLLVKHLKD